MEVLIELLLELFGEVLLQVLLQALSEAGLHFVRRGSGAPTSDWLLVLGYLGLGAIVGGLSLLVFPHSLVHARAARVALLALAPLAGGLAMAGIGRWRSRRGQAVIPLDRFAFGVVFGFGMAAVRFVWAG